MVEFDSASVLITREDNGTHGQYIARLEGLPEKGRLTWVSRGGVRVAEHTVVDPAIRRHGVAAKLVEALVADAREQGFSIDPQCSYAAAQFRRHLEWSDLLASGEH